MHPSLDLGFSWWNKSIWGKKKLTQAYACDQLSKCKCIWAGYQTGSQWGLPGSIPCHNQNSVKVTPGVFDRSSQLFCYGCRQITLGDSDYYYRNSSGVLNRYLKIVQLYVKSHLGLGGNGEGSKPRLRSELKTWLALKKSKAGEETNILSNTGA